ncbi:MAG: hypothetical protein ACREAK_02650 [Nitrosarchaeum sp.]
MKQKMTTQKVYPSKSHDDISKNIQKYNPTLKNILKIEYLFIEYREFDSKAQIAKKLDVTMRPPVLNVILRYLEESSKILVDNDGSMIWIHASPKAKKSWEKAVKL